jgi:hypothetical protein
MIADAKRRESLMSSSYPQATPSTTPTTFAEVEGFVDMLRGACEDRDMHQILEQILTQPDTQRKQLVHAIVADIRRKRAPKELVDALICLLDDAAAERAYAVIFRCESRPSAKVAQ